MVVTASADIDSAAAAAQCVVRTHERLVEFLEAGLKDIGEFAWQDLVVPLAVGVFAITVWLLRNSHDH